MKLIFAPGLIFLSILLGTSVGSAAGFSSRSPVDAVVVSEQVSSPAPGANTGRTAAVYDAGYIEAGDPVAGDPAPTPGEIGQALRSALQADGFIAAERGGLPDVLIVYHWGVLHTGGRGGHPGVSSIDSLFRARLYLTAPTRVAEDIEGSLSRHQTVNWTQDRQDAFQLARGDRYFVIVSAYDYPALDKNQAVLLWRTRISSRASGPSMRETLPALIAAGQGYFGRNADSSVDVSAPLVSLAAPDAAAPFASRPEVATSATDKMIRHIIDQEVNEFSGGSLASNR